MCKVDRILSKVWLRYKFHFSLRMILEPDVPGSKKIWHVLRKEDSPAKPRFIQEINNKNIKMVIYVEIGPHITIRSFWCKQPNLPSQDTREASKARFIYLPQYDTWMISRTRYSAFFNKQPQSFRHKVLSLSPAKSLRG